MALEDGPCISPLGVHHHGVVVSDLDASIAFYGEMFGAQPSLRVDHDHGSLVMLDFANCHVELLAFDDPVPRDDAPGATELGAGHVALAVSDCVAAHERLAARGVAFAQPPARIADGPSEGYVIAFCLDPDGNRVELIQEP